MKGNIRYIVGGFALITILTSGCAVPGASNSPLAREFLGNRNVNYTDRFDIAVDSISAPGLNITGSAYVIASAMQDIDENDLQFQEAASYAENALSLHGCRRVYKKEDADQLVRIAYGIGSPQTSSSTVTTRNGYGYWVGDMYFYNPPATAQQTETTYTRNLVLEAYDLKDKDRQAQIWKTVATSTGTMSDLRFVIVYMFTAAEPYLGKDTNGQIVRTINQYPSDDVLYIKYGPRSIGQQ